MEYRFYKEGGEEELVNLLIEVFDGWPKFNLNCSTLDHWNWKFIDNPLGSIIVLALDEGRIIGFIKSLYKQVIVGNNQYKTAAGADTGIHLDYRGEGVYRNIFELRKKEELDEMRKSLELEKRKLEESQKQYSGYKKNVVELAKKINSMRPDESVQIMLRWEDTLVIDVLRQMDAEAAEAGTGSITSYLISLMPRDRASRIMYLMTQL